MRKIFVVTFANKKSGDKIPFGRTIDRNGFVFPLPRYNTGSTMQCNYSAYNVNPGDKSFELQAYDVATQKASTSTTLCGYAIVILI